MFSESKLTGLDENRMFRLTWVNTCPTLVNLQHRDNKTTTVWCGLTCSRQRRATLNSIMQLTVIQFRPTCCFKVSGGKSMLDDNKPARKLKGNYMSSLLLQLHTHTHTGSTLTHTHISPIVNRYISDSYFDLSLVTSCFVFPPGLMFLWQSEWDFELLFNMPAFQHAIIKASSQRYEELKLPQSSKPIISPRARLKILIQTNNMSAWDHFTLVKSPKCRAKGSDTALIRLQKSLFSIHFGRKQDDCLKNLETIIIIQWIVSGLMMSSVIILLFCAKCDLVRCHLIKWWMFPYFTELNMALPFQSPCAPVSLHSSWAPIDNRVERVHHYLHNSIFSRLSYYLVLQEAWSNFYI